MSILIIRHFLSYVKKVGIVAHSLIVLKLVELRDFRLMCSVFFYHQGLIRPEQLVYFTVNTDGQ